MSLLLVKQALESYNGGHPWKLQRGATPPAIRHYRPNIVSSHLFRPIGEGMSTKHAKTSYLPTSTSSPPATYPSKTTPPSTPVFAL